MNIEELTAEILKSETPETLAFVREHVQFRPWNECVPELVMFARTLERRLAESNSNLADAKLPSLEHVQAIYELTAWKEMARSLADCVSDLIHHGSVVPDNEGEPIQHQANPENAIETVRKFDELKLKYLTK